MYIYIYIYIYIMVIEHAVKMSWTCFYRQTNHGPHAFGHPPETPQQTPWAESTGSSLWATSKTLKICMEKTWKKHGIPWKRCKIIKKTTRQRHQPATCDVRFRPFCEPKSVLPMGDVRSTLEQKLLIRLPHLSLPFSCPIISESWRSALVGTFGSSCWCWNREPRTRQEGSRLAPPKLENQTPKKSSLPPSVKTAWEFLDTKAVKTGSVKFGTRYRGYFMLKDGVTSKYCKRW